MKPFLPIAISLLLLTACQQEKQQNQSEKQPEATTAEAVKESLEKRVSDKGDVADPKVQSGAEHGHSHEETTAESTATGEKYKIVEQQVECEEPVVIEFFAYHCPHCYSLEPSAEAWRNKNGGKVKFQSVPTTLGHEQMGSMLLVHHAAKTLGILDKTQHALFNRFHEEKKLFGSQEEAVDFLVAQGADATKAKKVLEDKEAMSESIQADYELLAKYKISSVPQVLVNHQYVTSMVLAGTSESVFETVDETLKLEHGCKLNK